MKNLHGIALCRYLVITLWLVVGSTYVATELKKLRLTFASFQAFATV